MLDKWFPLILGHPAADGLLGEALGAAIVRRDGVLLRRVDEVDAAAQDGAVHERLTLGLVGGVEVGGVPTLRAQGELRDLRMVVSETYQPFIGQNTQCNT